MASRGRGRGGGRSSRSSSSRSRSRGRSTSGSKSKSKSSSKSSNRSKSKSKSKSKSSSSTSGSGSRSTGTNRRSTGPGRTRGTAGFGGTVGPSKTSVSTATSWSNKQTGALGAAIAASKLANPGAWAKALSGGQTATKALAVKAQKVAAEKSAFSVAALGFNTAFGSRQPDSKLSKTQSTGTFTSWHDSGTVSKLQAAIDRSKEANPAAWGQVTGERVNLGSFTSALTEAKEKSYDRTHQINLNPTHVTKEGGFNLVEATKGFFAKHTAFVLTPEASATSDFSAEISAVPTTDQKPGSGRFGLNTESIAGDEGGATMPSSEAMQDAVALGAINFADAVGGEEKKQPHPVQPMLKNMQAPWLSGAMNWDKLNVGGDKYGSINVTRLGDIGAELYGSVAKKDISLYATSAGNVAVKAQIEMVHAYDANEKRIAKYEADAVANPQKYHKDGPKALHGPSGLYATRELYQSAIAQGTGLMYGKRPDLPGENSKNPEGTLWGGTEQIGTGMQLNPDVQGMLSSGMTKEQIQTEVEKRVITITLSQTQDQREYIAVSSALEADPTYGWNYTKKFTMEDGKPVMKEFGPTGELTDMQSAQLETGHGLVSKFLSEKAAGETTKAAKTADLIKLLKHEGVSVEMIKNPSYGEQIYNPAAGRATYNVPLYQTFMPGEGHDPKDMLQWEGQEPGTGIKSLWKTETFELPGPTGDPETWVTSQYLASREEPGSSATLDPYGYKGTEYQTELGKKFILKPKTSSDVAWNQTVFGDGAFVMEEQGGYSNIPIKLAAEAPRTWNPITGVQESGPEEVSHGKGIVPIATQIGPWTAQTEKDMAHTTKTGETVRNPDGTISTMMKMPSIESAEYWSKVGGVVNAKTGAEYSGNVYIGPGDSEKIYPSAEWITDRELELKKRYSDKGKPIPPEAAISLTPSKAKEQGLGWGVYEREVIQMDDGALSIIPYTLDPQRPVYQTFHPDVLQPGYVQPEQPQAVAPEPYEVPYYVDIPKATEMLQSGMTIEQIMARPPLSSEYMYWTDPYDKKEYVMSHDEHQEYLTELVKQKKIEKRRKYEDIFMDVTPSMRGARVPRTGAGRAAPAITRTRMGSNAPPEADIGGLVR